jgi:hypothetical protein
LAMRTITTYRKSGRLFILRVMGIYRQLVEEDRGQACSLLELCHTVL